MLGQHDLLVPLAAEVEREAQGIAGACELSNHQWRQEQSALGERLGCDYTQPSLSALYRASDRLWKQHDEIESFVYQQHGALFGLEETLTLFDLTNIFFEGTGKYNDHAAYGETQRLSVGDTGGGARWQRFFPAQPDLPRPCQRAEHLATDDRAAAHAGRCGAGAGQRPGTGAARRANAGLIATGAGSARPAPTIVMDAGIASDF